MLADVSSILPVITKLYDATGERTDLDDIQIVKFDATLTLTRSTAIGPPTVIIGVYAAPATTLPAAGMAFAPASAAGTDNITPIVFANLEGSTHVGTIEWIPYGNLAAHNTDYLIVDIYETDYTGAPVDASYFTGTTEITATGGRVTSGTWATNTVAWTIGLGIDIGAGNKLVASWDHAGAGKAKPFGYWRIT